MADRTRLGWNRVETRRIIRGISLAFALSILMVVAGFGQTKPERQSKAAKPPPVAPAAATPQQNASETATSEPAGCAIAYAG